MQRFLTVSLVVFFAAHWSLQVAGNDPPKFYDFVVKRWDQSDLQLQALRGKVTLVMNVASYCGWTDNHYRAFSEFYNEVGNQYFSILAFPCNQFGQQEPEEVAMIKENMEKKYGVQFDLMEKVDVLGEYVNPAWKFLIEESGVTPDWNFYKYLIDADGDVLAAWGPKTNPEDVIPVIRDAIHKAQRRDEL